MQKKALMTAVKRNLNIVEELVEKVDQLTKNQALVYAVRNKQPYCERAG